MSTLFEKYKKEAVPALRRRFELSNDLAVPRVEKVSVNVGTGRVMKEGKTVEDIERDLSRITGQKSVRTKARIAVAGFKIRQGQEIGLLVTLRGRRMWDFLARLIHMTFPRIRDFRGIPETLVDAQGNISIGFREHLPFPEIRSDEVERVHGLQVTINTKAGNRKNGLLLFKALGFPFQR